ncbi:carboxypeptidase-like regulatory domain-containing protein [Janthinobacterium fluminis]|uniref:Carboxypeptidase-like regulatory domain-containing protein n=1 Tax=Janthinobacterium fluminis TaxID=2987524 RepID=A0ABT5JW00_9BURK|nr:carboxypeptidase-like regulatory domain-containing protein [Janthinobacterium fluminis]MDC8756600.1 carboxypeptidase-like regulatory domain-containing protein [Janthinobacterium fluminis]
MSSKNTGARKVRHGTVQVSVQENASGAAIVNAAVSLYRSTITECNSFDPATWTPVPADRLGIHWTDSSGNAAFSDLAPGNYVLVYENFPRTCAQCAEVRAGCGALVCFEPELDPKVTLRFETADCQPSNCQTARVSDRAFATISFCGDQSNEGRELVTLVAPAPWKAVSGVDNTFSSAVRRPGRHLFAAQMLLARRPELMAGLAGLPGGPGGAGPGAMLAVNAAFDAEERTPQPISGNVGVSLTRTETEPTEDLPLWTLIRNSTEAMSFTNYLHFMDSLFCTDTANVRGFEQERFVKKAEAFQQLKQRRVLPFTDSDAYRVLKVATEAFVMVNCGVLNQPLAFNPAEDNAYLDRRDIPPGRDLETVLRNDYLENVDGFQTLPYLAVIRRKLPDIPISIPRGQEGDVDLCFGIIQEKLANPCLLELIWSYWHEEGMLVQTMNAITQRFQNLRAPGLANDPLANTEIDMLRPLNNLLWGYTQDEQHRLTVVRRNYEYDHHYGVRLDGKAVQHFRPADSRSKFLEAFHHLLRLLTSFYKQDDDTTVKADAFPVLNALKEVHLILSQGAHNQFGDLPSTARIEMLMQQWLLARPEFREFLPTRVMVAYPEPWMDRVDAMKKLQGWTDTSVMHFRSLAMFGEQLLLSVRYGNWSDIYEPTQAFNWARFWRPQVQGYIHGYRAATGVDLSVDAVDPAAEATLPSVLLRQRLAQQVRGV